MKSLPGALRLAIVLGVLGWYLMVRAEIFSVMAVVGPTDALLYYMSWLFAFPLTGLSCLLFFVGYCAVKWIIDGFK